MIYGWSPGIGDPGLLGWITVFAYFSAATMAYAAGQRSRRRSLSEGMEYHCWIRASRFWAALAIVLVALGINKQLDLQSLFTVVVRQTAKEQGWYAERRGPQRLFIAGTSVTALTIVGFMIFSLHDLERWVKLAAAGAIMLLTFIVVRAASFHHVDIVLGSVLGGVRINHLLELGGIGIIVAAATRAAPRMSQGNRTPRRHHDG
jgi:hypothetical protein